VPPSPAPSARADAVVVAAGSSRRMDGRDKLAVPIAGRPVLAWSLAAVAAAPSVERIVVVTAPDRVAAIEAADWLPAKVVAVVPGGARRQESVAAGVARLEAADGDLSPEATAARPVLVHDGARPCVPVELIEAVVAATAEHGAAIPVVAVAETLKRVHDGELRGTVEREGLAAAQTPQGVRRDVLRAAYDAAPAGGPRTFTDEAALLEACRIRVRAIPGDPANLKVTLPSDLRRAEALLGVPRPPRVGIGHDEHAFGPGSPLTLGGIVFAAAPRLHGHSDGDVVLHAIADALLGGAGLGDLGRAFPADHRTPRGVASSALLADVVRRVADAGLRPASVDVVVVAARPRLVGRLDEMSATIGALLGLDAGAVNVKASTGNLDGSAGAGRGVAAQAVVVLEPRGDDR
jgi:2-C-methyl-D-erythritol 4-phosphate cytidylyltransferase/2-C-methyl-D-erythritol 2,4-cyclodiphosphate synthase